MAYLPKTGDNMTLEQAQAKAQKMANETGNSVLVYRSTLHPSEYGTALTLPNFAQRIGERIYNTVDVNHGNGLTTLAYQEVL